MTTNNERLWNHAIENEDYAYADAIGQTVQTPDEELVDGYQIEMDIDTGAITCSPVRLPASAYPKLQRHSDIPGCPYDTPLF